MEERDHAMVEAAGSNPAFRSTFGCALAPPATRAPWDRRSGDVHGVAPHVQREDLVGLPITRAWTQPKVEYALAAQMEEQLPCKQRVARSNRRLGSHTCRVRLAGRGHLSFKEATRVRIPYTTPVRMAGRLLACLPGLISRCNGGSIPSPATNTKSCPLTRRAETGRKDWAAPELVTGPMWIVAREDQGAPLLRESRHRRRERSNRSRSANKYRGCSSVGRAPALQAGCRRFEACRLHQIKVC